MGSSWLQLLAQDDGVQHPLELWVWVCATTAGMGLAYEGQWFLANRDGGHLRLGMERAP